MGRLLAQLVGTLLLVGIVLHFIWWIIGAAAVVGGVWLAARMHRAALAAEEAERRRQAEICARVDLQHKWVMAGDPRGTCHLSGHGRPPVRRSPRLVCDRVVGERYCGSTEVPGACGAGTAIRVHPRTVRPWH